MSIAKYFREPAEQLAALKAYEEFSQSAKWPIRELIATYSASARAFAPATPTEEAFEIFERSVYQNLKNYWQVFRSSNTSSEHWTAKKTFDVMRTEFAGLGWQSDTTLQNVRTKVSAEAMVSRFGTLRELKSNVGFPVMAASKFLHFFNPRLFPIYDNEIIWKRVLKVFKIDFRNYCSEARLTYDLTDSSVFLRNYIWWGSSLVCQGHPGFMNVFANWLEPLAPGALIKDDLRGIYATAFEFTIIGAERLMTSQQELCRHAGQATE
jgi:hypothetical protein